MGDRQDHRRRFGEVEPAENARVAVCTPGCKE
jgi:hypothetical protein